MSKSATDFFKLRLPKGNQMNIRHRAGENEINVILAVIMLTFTFFLFAPLELYIANKDALWFSVNMFWWMPVVTFFLASFVLLIFGKIVYKLFETNGIQIYTLFVFAIGICIWIQGNFLNAVRGGLTGAEFNIYDIKKEIIIDLCVWGVVFAGLFMLNAKYKNKLHKIVKYVSILILGMQLLTLIYLNIIYMRDTDFRYKQTEFISKEGLYEFGSDGNVIVFVLDMFDDDYFKDILKESPEIKNKLEGFTYFNNYTGLYSTTEYSLTSMLTGQVFKNEKPHNIWVEDCAKDKIYIDELYENGYQIYIYTDIDNAIPNRIKEMQSNYVNAELKITNKKSFYICLYRLVACKYLPNIFKKFFYMNGNEFDGLGNKFFPSNKEFRDSIYNGVFSIKDNTKKYMFIHIFGAHFPYDIDEDGNYIKATYTEPVKHAKGILKVTIDYMEQLKKLGLYDNSAIIITADHGFASEGTLTSPVFLVKKMNAKKEFKINNVPASQKNFGATVLDIAGIESYSVYGTSDMDIKNDDNVERYFYQYNLREGFYDFEKEINNFDEGNIRLIEYAIPSQNNSAQNFCLTGNEYTVTGEVINHYDYCLTCQEERDWEYGTHYKPVRPHICTKDNPGYKYINKGFWRQFK